MVRFLENKLNRIEQDIKEKLHWTNF